MSFLQYRKSLAFVESFSNTSFRKNFGPKKRDPSFFLDRTRYFLHSIGDPGRGFKYIHVTGTAGKGTVSTMLQNVLSQAGKKAGLFTSPYSTAAIEEIKIGDLYISPREFASIVEHLKPFIAKAAKGPFGAPSTFEIFLAIALVYFKRQKCEWVVLEVGLGGRYDATNFVAKPVVTAITNIDYDHTEILGKTLGEIAFDKAGIIKKGSAFFTSEQRSDIRDLFREECSKKKSAFVFSGKADDHRVRNISLVKAIAEHIGISHQFVDFGIKRTRLPCRFEIIQERPIIILDGAHNRAKIASTISNLRGLPYGRLIVVTGIADLKKDNKAILEPLAQVADKMILTSFAEGDRIGVNPKALLPLVTKFKKRSTSVMVEIDPDKALNKAIKSAKTADCILVTGSFFLAGKLRTRWYPEERILRSRKSF